MTNGLIKKGTVLERRDGGLRITVTEDRERSRLPRDEFAAPGDLSGHHERPGDRYRCLDCWAEHDRRPVGGECPACGGRYLVRVRGW